MSFVLDSADRITLTGLYNGTGNVGGPSFPAFAGTPGRYDVFVAGLSSGGVYGWQTTINTDEDCFPGPGVPLGTAPDVFVVGNFMGAAKIGGVDHVSAGSWDAYFTRIDDSNGTVGAVATWGGAGDDRAVAAVTTPNDIVVFGTFHDQVTFPTSPVKTLTSAGGADIFVARVSRDGVMSDVVAFGGTGDDIVEAVHSDGSGIVVAGDFTSPSLSVMGGAALSNAGGYDFFVARLGFDSSHEWSVRFGGTGDDRVRDLAVGPRGEIAVTGEFRNSITFGSSTHDAVRGADSGPTEIDVFLAKLTPRGRPVWSIAVGGPAQDRGLGVALDGSSAVYMTASFKSPVDFGGGKTLTPDVGEWASALVKYAP